MSLQSGSLTFTERGEAPGWEPDLHGEGCEAPGWEPDLHGEGREAPGPSIGFSLETRKPSCKRSFAILTASSRTLFL